MCNSTNAEKRYVLISKTLRKCLPNFVFFLGTQKILTYIHTYIYTTYIIYTYIHANILDLAFKVKIQFNFLCIL